MPDRHLTRRSFFGIAAAATAGALVPSSTFAATHAVDALANMAPERTLSFFHTHTEERLTTTYCTAGDYVAGALHDLNHLLRDFRVNVVKPIDPELLDLLFVLNARLGTNQPFHVISGYRTPETNAMLQERGDRIVVWRRTACTSRERRSTSAFQESVWSIFATPPRRCRSAGSVSIRRPTSFTLTPDG